MFKEEQTYSIFASDREREIYREIAGLDRIVIHHPGMKAAVDGIKNCIKASVWARSPECCMLLGDGGMGKTTIAKMIMAALPPQTIVKDDCEIDTTPAFYMSLPPGGKVSHVTEAMLTNLNDRDPLAGSGYSKDRRIARLLTSCGTVIVFIDELHNLSLIQQRDPLAGQKISAWLKGLFNVEATVICLLGTLECQSIFDHSAELSRRFKNKFLLIPLDCGTPDAPGTLQMFLQKLSAQIVKNTSVTGMPNFSNYGLALSVFAATQGSIDFAATLLKDAARNCLLAGRDVVTEEDLAYAFSTGKSSSQALTGNRNPFHMERKHLAKLIRG
ncbi:TniB family NTP-binding protein [Cupriavidus pinatubonensis]|uniref:AAA+ ATPase domain-containing protein n=1 Tax=Cupriavidus pinatubonensis TaxID=248026 RepID=A0ABM8XKB8_9BURK|nr:TniB family NTP-binding protein [Cupriavidus pinatubonensis]CAG9180654.1 hypothetical protein LMG23994_04469 [Cupriavidus pinatubonensis]